MTGRESTGRGWAALTSAHPKCIEVHVCQQPSGRVCIDTGCTLPAGTLWGPLWCPDHDRDRLNRVTAQMESIAESLRS